MPQQINLCTPLLQTPTQRFAATTLVQALAVLIVVGGALAGAWLWSLHQARIEFVQATQARAQEVRELQATIDRTKAMIRGPSPELQKQVQDRQAEVQAREAVLQALRDGVLVPGAGHSDRLALVARSIPAPVWVTEVRADGQRFEVSGFTLEPAALNDWVGRLAQSPLMQGLRLDTVKVDSAAVASAAPIAGVASAPAPAAGGRESWSFTLVNAQPQSTPVGGKP